MATRRAWTRDELLLALRLYMRTPFGKLHKYNPEIIELAEKLERTPSAVGMKACNFASLDPQLRERGIGGLKSASNADRAVWGEFAENPESLAAEAEEAAARFELSEQDDDVWVSTQDEERPMRQPSGQTEIPRLIRARRVQSFFRAAVLTSYETRCAISGIPIPQLLTASHIIPWSVSIERRADPTNGLCLNALFDRAFDRGFMTIDERLRIVVAPRLLRELAEATRRCDLERAHGRTLTLPKRFPPDAAALAYHREHVFRES